MRAPRKAAEYAIAYGHDDPFDYDLALHLGWSHGMVGELPHAEYIRWRAYWNWRAAMKEHDAKVQAMRLRAR